MDTHSAVPADPTPAPEPRFSTMQVIYTACTALSAAGTTLWPAGDLVYNGHFGFPRAWWIAFLSALVGLILLALETKSRRDRQTQAVMMAEIHIVRLDMDSLAESVRDYGNLRETEGHAAALNINGRGVVRQLHPID